jgi:ABC-type thiamin/hydroxymethylpyrimidine transport system permease subunit
MWLKVIIVLLFLAIVASLSSGLVFLLKDMGSSSKRTLYALGVRITLAALLLFCIWYGYYSGILSNTAPWAGQY